MSEVAQEREGRIDWDVLVAEGRVLRQISIPGEVAVDHAAPLHRVQAECAARALDPAGLVWQYWGLRRPAQWFDRRPHP